MDSLPDDAPSPRLCHLIKWFDFDGYGFNLHAERSNPGQFIGKIDDDSPAQMAGLREGDRIVEVNGVNISNENHRQVVERIKSDPEETKLLVVDSQTDGWYKEQDLVIKSSQLNVVYIKTPVPRPQPDSPRAKFHNNNTLAADKSAEMVSASPHSSASVSPSASAGLSLETSDFNDDSIEQMPPQPPPLPPPSGALQSLAKTRHAHSPAPMSPDSGKGDEEPSPAVTIEAEINRQQPPASMDTIGLEHVEVTSAPSPAADEQELDSNSNSNSSDHLEPDSLSQAGASMSPCPTASQVSNVVAQHHTFLPICYLRSADKFARMCV